MRLILASISPRRREILALLGLPFEVMAPTFQERVSEQTPIEKEVIDFALGKARSVAKGNPRSTVIGSDTMILLEGKKIGKPADLDDARRMLRTLAGKRHDIYTGVVIIGGSGERSAAMIEKVSIQMRPFGEGEINQYLACGESLDKAGAYSIQGQGRNLITAMDGDYLAAVGLPLKPIAQYLASQGFEPLRDIARLYEAKAFMNWRSFD